MLASLLGLSDEAFSLLPSLAAWKTFARGWCRHPGHEHQLSGTGCPSPSVVLYLGFSGALHPTCSPSAGAKHPWSSSLELGCSNLHIAVHKELVPQFLPVLGFRTERHPLALHATLAWCRGTTACSLVACPVMSSAGAGRVMCGSSPGAALS